MERFPIPLQRGIRPYAQGTQDGTALLSCRGARPMPNGLWYYEEMQEPFTSATLTGASITDDWPFPQILRGRGVTLLATRTSIYQVNESDWSLSLLTFTKMEEPDTESLANGTFTGNATGWTLSGFAYGDNKISCTASSTPYAEQAAGSQAVPIVSGKRYRVQYTLSITTGGIRVKLGTNTGLLRTVSGTYVDEVVANGTTFRIEVPSGSFTGSVDSISVQEIATTSVTSLPSGGQWHFSDFANTWFLHNGACTAMCLGGSLWYQDITTVNTGCAFRGRFLIGGLASDFWTDGWKTQLSSWLPAAFGKLTTADMNMAGNFVAWSSIGGGDALLWLYPRLGLNPRTGYQPYADAYPLLQPYLDRNEMGFMPMTFQGTVLCLKPLGKGVVAYGEDGISYMPMVQEPFATFGLIHISDVGLLGRGAVGGDETEHVFIDTSGTVWRLSMDLSLQREGYHHVFNKLLTYEPIVSRNPRFQEYFIGTSAEGYVLAEAGLSEIRQSVTSCVFVAGDTVGMFVDTPDPDMRVQTDTFDMGYNGIKTLHSVQISGDHPTGLLVYVLSRFDKSGPFLMSEAISTDARGVATCMIPGLEFQLIVEAPSGFQTRMDSISVMWGPAVRRNVRSLLNV